MVFSNLTFVCLFLPIVLALYHGAPHSARNLVLVVASMVFYVWGGRVAIVLVLVSIAVNFMLGRAIAAADAERRTRLIRWSVAGNLLVLIVFKYADFLVDNANVVLAAFGDWKIPDPKLPLPLGISFITFHLISYLVDVYRGTAEAQRSPVPFALYILNFPQLVAGPIIRYRPMAPQLARREVAFEDIDAGVMRFVAGLAKKLLIANPLGAVADQLFAIEPSGLPAWALWLARGVLRAADLFRLLRLFGHGDRDRADVRLPLSGELQLSVQRDLDPGLLAALAHHAVGVVP